MLDKPSFARYNHENKSYKKSRYGLKTSWNQISLVYTTRWREKRRQYIGFLNTNLILVASFVKRTKEKERISYEVCWPFAGGEHSWNKWEEMKKRKREWGWEGKIANRKKWKIIMTSSNEKLGSAGDWCFTTWVLVSCQYSRISSLLAVTEPSATTQ